MNRFVGATLCIALPASCTANQGTHDYSSTNPQALRDYNAGWSYILDARSPEELAKEFEPLAQHDPEVGDPVRHRRGPESGWSEHGGAKGAS